MAEQAKKWNEVPAGIYQTGWNRLVHELGDDAGAVLARLNTDTGFARRAAKSLVEQADRKIKLGNQKTMMDVKQVFGTRLFLASEIREMFGMTADEEKLIPELTPKQIKKLWTWGRSEFCPFTNRMAYENYMVFPMPGIIRGMAVNLNELSRILGGNPKIDLDLAEICDAYHNKPRDPEWHIVFLGYDGSNGVGHNGEKWTFGYDCGSYEAQREKLPKGYRVSDPTLLAFMLALWHRRTGKLSPNTFNGLHHVWTSATGRSARRSGAGRVVVGRTVDPSIPIYAAADTAGPIGGDRKGIAVYRLVSEL